MANQTSTVPEYWDRHAGGVTAESDLDAAFGWTQWDGHGPGRELLGDAGSALELGCGRGVEVAALAREGVKAEGSMSPPSRWSKHVSSGSPSAPVSTRVT